MNDISHVEALRAAVYGEAIGDALGVPYEFKDRGTFTCTTMVGHGTWSQPAGTWSDDTSMMLATLDSMLSCGGSVHTEDMRQRYDEWVMRGAYTQDGKVFDIGRTCLRALGLGHGLDGEYDNGNGSLMRIAPLAFFDISDEDIRQASAITHAHPTSMNACVTYIHILRELIAGLTPREAIASTSYDGIWERKNDDISSTGYVLHTLEAALWSLSTTDSYQDCVLRAVNLGTDTDTTAAVVGALAGTYYGFEAIPQEWLSTLRKKEIIDNIIWGTR